MQKLSFIFKSAIFALLSILLFSDSAKAIPSFARKYKTSCATCHVGYPKLTPFGEAYRLNGFQMPENEAGAVKEEPVKLGSQGYKRVWPKAIWPGEISGTSPVSFRVRSGLTYVKNDEESYFNFGQPALQMMTGGTFTENISFYAGAHLFEGGETGSIDRLYLRFNNLFSKVLPYGLLNIRVGQFIPDIVTYYTNHRSLTHSAYAFNTFAGGQTAFTAGHAHGGAAFGLEAFQLGTEASGLISPRFRYVIGLINGNGAEEDNNSAKDYYGKAAYKLGGLAFDGSSSGEIYGASANNWAEKSLTFSVFAYSGTGTPTEEDSGEEPAHDGHRILSRVSSSESMTSGTEDYDFNRFGFDANLFLRDLNLFGGFISGEDGHDSYDLFFSEANYMVFPWLIAALRFEQANPKDADTIQQLVIHTTALYTANLKFNLETVIDPGDINFSNIICGLDFAF